MMNLNYWENQMLSQMSECQCQFIHCIRCLTISNRPVSPYGTHKTFHFSLSTWQALLITNFSRQFYNLSGSLHT